MAEASAAADSLNGRKPLPTVVLKNGGSLREPLQAGDLSLTDLFRWCPNNGMVVATDASYSTLYRILSRSLDSVRMADSLRYSPETGSGAFLQTVEQYSRQNKTLESIDFEANHALARKAAKNCAVLLQNRDHLRKASFGARIGYNGRLFPLVPFKRFFVRRRVAARFAFVRLAYFGNG